MMRLHITFDPTHPYARYNACEPRFVPHSVSGMKGARVVVEPLSKENSMQNLVLSRLAAGSLILAALAFQATSTAQAGGVSPRVAESSSLARFEAPRFTPDGSALVLSGPDGLGLYVLERTSGTLTRVTPTRSAGRVSTLSPDGEKVGFKQLLPTSWGGFVQVPSIYSRRTGQVQALIEPVAVAGVPSFASDGRMALPVGRDLQLLSPEGTVLKTFDLCHDVNLTPFIEGGRAVVFNDPEDRLWRLDLASGARTPLTPEGEGFFGPSLSPDGQTLLLQHLRGEVWTLSLPTRAVRRYGPGVGARWADDGAIVFSRQTRTEGRSLDTADLFRIPPGGGTPVPLTQTADRLEGAATLASSQGLLAWESLEDGGILLAKLGREGQPWRLEQELRRVQDALPATDGARPTESLLEDPQRSAPAATIQIANVPYIHQVYDTRDDFNGNSACNATSATMCLAYYSILPVWNTTASWPYSHTSPYGNYISEIYTFNGHTYNVGSPSPSDIVEYGGYGYIVQNDWEDTKGHMAEYLTYHGLESAVDWSPSWSKLQTEVAAKKPFVVLNSLTSSGHYIVAIGYLDTQHTAVYNDPYGDKNDGYTNYYGAGVLYDWPGYNNGYSNLNTAWCFIWARGITTPPPASTGNLLGYVRDSDIYSGKGLVATVTLSSGQSMSTDAAGYYKFSSLPTGTYTVTVKAPCYGTATFSKTLSANTDTWGSVALLPDGSCSVPGTLKGTVLAADTGAALAGAAVTLSTGAVSTSDASGQFTFSGLSVGTYTVTASAECYGDASSTVGVASGGTTSVSLSLAAADCSSGGCGGRTMALVQGSVRFGLLVPTGSVLLLGLLGMRRRRTPRPAARG